MPIMALEGHDGDIFATKFHPEGDYLASSGFDRKICKYNMFIILWHIYEPELYTFIYIDLTYFSYMECVWRM